MGTISASTLAKVDKVLGLEGESGVGAAQPSLPADPRQQAERRWQQHDAAVAQARARPRPAEPPVIVCEEVRSRERPTKVTQWRWRCEWCRC